MSYGNAYGHQAQMGFDWGGVFGPLIQQGGSAAINKYLADDDQPQAQVVYMQPPATVPAGGGFNMGAVGPYLLWAGGGAAVGYFLGRGRKKKTYAMIGAAAGAGAKFVMGGFPA